MNTGTRHDLDALRRAGGVRPSRDDPDRCPAPLRWATAVGNADWHVTAPLLAPLAAGLGTGTGTVTAAVGAYSLGHGLALPLWGRLADRHGPLPDRKSVV